MKVSIRTRLFLGISSLILFFVASSWLLNSQLLGKYYLLQKKETLLKSKQRVDQLYTGNPSDILIILETLERNSGINVYFLGTGLELKYDSFFNIHEIRRGRRPDSVIFQIKPETFNLSVGESNVDIVTDPRLKTDFLVLVSRLSNGEILVLSSPIAAINESTAIANKFLLFTGILTIGLGGVAVFLFTQRFTRPILELNEIANRMSKLDFSKKYSAHTDDEIGELGSSINSLSYQLDKAISELKEANSKLTEDIERERKIDEMRKNFISNVSHELKTPIALIQGYAEGLKLNVNEDEENKEYYCDVIMDEADKMNVIVKDLLDLSQIESGSFKLEKKLFDISCLVENVLFKYGPILREKGLEVHYEVTDNTAVLGDLVRLEQVLTNYLNNAINHVDIKKIIRISTIVENNKVRVSVYNSGNNIPAESLEKIWISFYKLDKARTREYGGTGLGLSVVRSIMERHANRFGVENKKDGVSFWFEVDRADTYAEK